jgi:hypothetical protein
MPADTIQIPEPVRQQLRLAFIDPEDLRGALDGVPSEPIASPPGCFRARPTLAVPRALDPETAEMRQIDVYLRPIEGGLEVFAVRGIDLEAVTG